MATSGNHDETETETTIDVSGFMRAFIQYDDDEKPGDKANRPGDVSMFCKACLHPYCGEQKSGTIVLRCERCGQTDTVLEESVDSLNPQEWIGNLMMNRFITVVKEQEDLSANLSDPHFAEDDYQRMSLFLSEYTFNIDKIVVHLYDIAKKANMAKEDDKVRIELCQNEDASGLGMEEVLAMNATKTLLDIHKTLIMNDPKQQVVNNTSEKDEKETGIVKENTSISDEQDKEVDAGIEEQYQKNSDLEERDISQVSQCENIEKAKDKEDIITERSDDYVDEIEEKREIVRNKLNMLGASVCALIENLSIKYNIPDDVMVAVQKKLLNIKTEDTTETNDNSTTETESNVVTSSEDNKEDSGNETEENDVVANKDKSNEKDESADSDDDDTDGRIFNVSTETIRQEVYDALGHKIKLSFEERPCAARKIDWSQTDESILDAPSNEESKGETGPSTFKSSQDFVTVDDSNLDLNPENTREEKVESCVESDKDICDMNGAVSQDDTFEVNFYSLACEYIRELQRRKNKALNERKDKALAHIHEKIERLKKEMDRVEEQVTEELALAYKRKMKKVEKQRKQLDEKHKQVKEAEKLLEFYTMTGQEDKVAELIEKFNFQYEN